MSSRSKTSHRELSFETIEAVLALRQADKSYTEISHQLKLARFTIVSFIQRHQRHFESSFARSKRADRFKKLTDCSKRAFFRHVELHSFDNLHALATSSKSSKQLHRNTVRRYLKEAGYFRFRKRRKFFLTVAHMKNRLKWAKLHQH